MPKQAQRIVDFANSPLHDRNWRERIGAVTVEPVISLPTPTDGSPVGVESLDAARAIQSEVQHLLNRIIEVAEGESFQKRAEVAATFARVEVRTVYLPHATENRFHATTQAGESSVLEVIYAHLAESLATDGFTAYGHCPTCGKFIYRRTEHGQRYCSDSCRALASFRRRRDATDAQPAEVPVAKARRPTRSRRSS